MLLDIEVDYLAGFFVDFVILVFVCRISVLFDDFYADAILSHFPLSNAYSLEKLLFLVSFKGLNLFGDLLFLFISLFYLKINSLKFIVFQFNLISISIFFLLKQIGNDLQFGSFQRKKTLTKITIKIRADSDKKIKLFLKMKKISVMKFKSDFKANIRLQTQESQYIEEKQIHKFSKNRFSCEEFLELPSKVPPSEKDPYRRNNFSQIVEYSTRDNLLRNMLEGSERKRSQILNNLIKSKRKLFRSSNKNDENFKKIIKVKTEEKQNYFVPLKLDRKRIFSKNLQSSRQNFRQSTCLNNAYDYLLSERKKPAIKLTQRESELLKSSFNKRIKEIKLRKYFQKDELETSLTNFFQAYGSSLKGEKHEQNQDSVFFSQGIYVLCDGHGSNGKQVSNFIAESIHNALRQVLEQHKIDETIILETYRKIELELENSNFDTSFSGCTCITLLRYENTFFCISLGDSRAIISKGYNVYEISSTQKPDKPKERQRIENYGGVVRPTELAKDKFVGPMRIWAPGKNSWGPGLALSRAFGDKAARKYGVISVPEVSQIKLTSDEEFIVMGSDGLFDYFGDQEICQFVKKLLKNETIPKEQISHELVKEAQKKWPQSSDDISCIIIFM